ncbi:HDIG domain-containing protein [bacterium]|nr:HDIG domain-containing protein [candidate division CSSED10-310 bacterium]
MISYKDIFNLFEELLLEITDEELREKTIETWVEGCRQGGWQTVEELHQIPFTLLTDACGISFIEHTIAVTRGAMGLLDAQINVYSKMPYTVNRDILIAGGILHDVGKLLEIEPDGKGGYQKSYSGKIARHPISGTVLAAQCGLTGPILNTIAAHAKEGDGRPRSLETVLIHQADFATFDPLVLKKSNMLLD